MRSGTIRILLVVAAVGVGLVLMFMPRQSASSRSKVDGVELVQATDAQKAAEKVMNGMNPMEGIMELRAIVERDSMNIEAQLYLARFSVQSGQIDKAIERYEWITRLVPDSLDGWWELAQVQFESGNFPDAEPLFAHVLEMDPAVTNAMFFRGKCREMMGDSTGAIALYAAFLPYAPDTAIHTGVERIIANLKKD
ncbi:MAG: tetratricopeptide repeat protein [Flavobacteriales bacterium]|nr:tetratricopeptide repeat protein [Flavobacteriales bacterium]